MQDNVIPDPITAVPSEEAFDSRLLKQGLQSGISHIIQGLLEDVLRTTPVLPESMEQSLHWDFERYCWRMGTPTDPPLTGSQLAFARGPVVYERMIENLRRGRFPSPDVGFWSRPVSLRGNVLSGLGLLMCVEIAEKDESLEYVQELVSGHASMGIPSVGLYVEHYSANKKPQISIIFASPGLPKDSGDRLYPFETILSRYDIGGESEVRFGLSEFEMGLYKNSSLEVSEMAYIHGGADKSWMGDRATLQPANVNGFHPFNVGRVLKGSFPCFFFECEEKPSPEFLNWLDSQESQVIVFDLGRIRTLATTCLVDAERCDALAEARRGATLK